jgi:hypothetical protein
MKKPNWTDPYASTSLPSLKPTSLIHGSLEQLQVGHIGRGFLGNVTVYLEIRENQDNRLFEAVVIGFDPPTAKIPDLQVTDKVEIDILHLLPGHGN